MHSTLNSSSGARGAVRLAALVLIAFCLLLAAPLGAKASTRHVVDEVDFISDATEAELEAEIARISKTYGQDVVILYRNLNEGESPMAVADDYFDYEGYGLGAERSGVLLLVSPSTRDWWISTRGESIPTFTDKGIKALGEILTEPLGDDEWEQAARTEGRADHERPEDLEGSAHPVGRSARRRGPGRLRGGARTRAEPLRLEDEERGPRTRGLLVRAFRCPSDHRRFGRVHHDEYHPDGEAGEQFGEQFGVLDPYLLLRSHARRWRRQVLNAPGWTRADGST